MKESMAGYRVLIVEDETVIAEMIKETLGHWDYEAQYVTDLKHVTDQVIQFEPHLILMDINLPYYNGFYWCKEIRTFSKVPIVFLSSADDNMNIVMAMNMGADDFIAKPFDATVLTAKVGAILRRSYSYQGQSNVLKVGNVILNLSDGVVSNGEEKVELTKNEFKILGVLMEQVGNMVSRENIMEKLWESDEFVDDNTLTVNVTRLRKKLKGIGVENFIKTKKGVGYLISEEGGTL